jgi:hypothetical protein
VKLLAFLPCEKVIISAKENVATLIAILQELTIQIPPGTTVPDGAVAPMLWYVFVIWLREADDDPIVEHKASLSLILPSKKRTQVAEMAFRFETETLRNIVQSAGFPISEAGPISLVLTLDGHEKATYPLLVKHVVPEIPTTTS